MSKGEQRIPKLAQDLQAHCLDALEKMFAMQKGL